MSNHDQSKYGYAQPRPPVPFRAQSFVAGGCLGCDEDVHPQDWVVYFDDKLFHEECGEEEWELAL